MIRRIFDPFGIGHQMLPGNDKGRGVEGITGGNIGKNRRDFQIVLVIKFHDLANRIGLAK